MKKELHFSIPRESSDYRGHSHTPAHFVFLQTPDSRYHDGWFWYETNKSKCSLFEQRPMLPNNSILMSVHKIKFYVVKIIHYFPV